MNLGDRCENCKFAKEFDPVDKPPEPEPKEPRTGLMRVLFGTGEDSWEMAFARSIAMRPYLRYKNRITCQRFPEFVEKYKTDTCGEYKNFREI